jgi:hypothetical protein
MTKVRINLTRLYPSSTTGLLKKKERVTKKVFSALIFSKSCAEIGKRHQLSADDNIYKCIYR